MAMFGLARSPLWRDQLAVSAKRRCSKPTFLVSIVNRLGADVKQTTMSRTLDALINDTTDVVFDNWGLQICGNCRGRSSSPFKDYADRNLGRLMSNTAFCISRIGLADSLVSFQGGHPSETEVYLQFCFFPLVVVANNCHTQENIVRLLTGDLFDWTRLGRPLYTSVSRTRNRA